MNKYFTLETKEQIKDDIALQCRHLANILTEEIEDNFKMANDKLITQQLLINTLEDRIDKAIEYIKNYYFYNSLDFDVKELLDILKGSDSND